MSGEYGRYTVGTKPGLLSRSEKILQIVLGAAMLLGVVQLVALGTVFPVDRLSGNYLTMASMLDHGGRYFVEVFDRRPPGLATTLSFLFSFTGPCVLPARGLMLIITVLTMGLLWKLSEAMNWDVPWRLGAVVAFIWIAPVYFAHTVMTEVPVMALGTAALTIVLGARKQLSVGRLFAAGLLVGATAWYKQAGLLYGPAIFIWMSETSFHQEWGSSRASERVVAFVVGILIPIGAMLAYFAATSRLPEFVQSNLVASSGSSSVHAGHALWASALSGQIVRGLLLWIPALIAGITSIVRYTVSGRDSAGSLLGIVLAFAVLQSLVGSGEDYLLAYLPVLCLLALKGVRQLERWLRMTKYSAAYVSVGMAILAIPTGIFYASALLPPAQADALGQQIAVLTQIDAESESDDPLIVVGDEPQYYFIADECSMRKPLRNTSHGLPALTPAELRRALHSPAGHRVIVSTSDSTGIEDIIEEIRHRGTLLFTTQITGREYVEVYHVAARTNAASGSSRSP